MIYVFSSLMSHHTWVIAMSHHVWQIANESCVDKSLLLWYIYKRVKVTFLKHCSFSFKIPNSDRLSGIGGFWLANKSCDDRGAMLHFKMILFLAIKYSAIWNIENIFRKINVKISKIQVSADIPSLIGPTTGRYCLLHENSQYILWYETFAA